MGRGSSNDYRQGQLALAIPEEQRNAGQVRLPEQVYQTRCADFAERRDWYAKRWSTMANVRLVLFLATVVIAGVGVRYGVSWFLLAAAAYLLAFGIAVAQHRRLGRMHRRYDELWSINDEGIKRLRRDWANLPLRRPASIPPPHPYAEDLDLLGHASLQHLLNTPTTPVGQAMLQSWLLQPATPAVARERQPAVGELAEMIDARDEFTLRGRQMGERQGDYEAFVRWAEGPAWLADRPWLLAAARLLPLAAIVLLALSLADILPYPLWVPIILLNMGVTLFTSATVDEVIDQVAGRQVVFRTYAELFQLLRSLPFEAPELQRIQQQLGASGLAADQQMRRLQRIMGLADLRMWLLYAPVQWLTLWNIHVLWLLERWQRVAGKETRTWLELLGQFEALAALATLKHDHPTWTFPELVETQTGILISWGLGHPLLRPETSVANEIELGPPGTFLLVTGSNMSGKSTLLRAIGVNIVLGQAGGPVHAFYLRLPQVVMATSMRVRDSLEQGISYFMAELQRLKGVVDAAHHAHQAKQATLIFLLDEILQGTNTAERQIAARAILQHLLDLGATGAVSTHDLDLVDVPTLAGRSRPVYFTEQFSRGPDGPVMQFDYMLRPGIAPSTNALKLMEILGLPTGEQAPETREQGSAAAPDQQSIPVLIGA